MAANTSTGPGGQYGSKHEHWTRRAVWQQTRALDQEGSMAANTSTGPGGQYGSKHEHWTRRAVWQQTRALDPYAHDPDSSMKTGHKNRV